MDKDLTRKSKIILKELIESLTILEIHKLVEDINKKYNTNITSGDIAKIMNKLDEEIKDEKMD